MGKVIEQKHTDKMTGMISEIVKAIEERLPKVRAVYPEFEIEVSSNKATYGSSQYVYLRMSRSAGVDENGEERMEQYSSSFEAKFFNSYSYERNFGKVYGSFGGYQSRQKFRELKDGTLKYQDIAVGMIQAMLGDRQDTIARRQDAQKSFDFRKQFRDFVVTSGLSHYTDNDGFGYAGFHGRASVSVGSNEKVKVEFTVSLEELSKLLPAMVEVGLLNKEKELK